MNLSGQVKKLIIVVGESDRVYQKPLYEAIVYASKKYKISGATVTRGILSYGDGSMVHSGKVFALAGDKPVVITMVDIYQRLSDFARNINRLMDKAGAGGLITMEDVEVLRYGTHHE